MSKNFYVWEGGMIDDEVHLFRTNADKIETTNGEHVFTKIVTILTKNILNPNIEKLLKKITKERLRGLKVSMEVFAICPR